jgi:hypothetical protein
MAREDRDGHTRRRVAGAGADARDVWRLRPPLAGSSARSSTAHSRTLRRALGSLALASMGRRPAVEDDDRGLAYLVGRDHCRAPRLNATGEGVSARSSHPQYRRGRRTSAGQPLPGEGSRQGVGTRTSGGDARTVAAIAAEIDEPYRVIVLLAAYGHCDSVSWPGFGGAGSTSCTGPSPSKSRRSS